MKKILYSVLILVCGMLVLSSCEKDDITGTATESMAGEWYVRVDAIDASGDVISGGEDFFSLGRFLLDTYNTAANVDSLMYVDDNDNFWEFKAVVDVDINAMTFEREDADNLTYDSQLTIQNGQIIYDGTTTPSGSVADSIVFTVKFSDDNYPEEYNFDRYRVSGFRYTGLDADEDD